MKLLWTKNNGVGSELIRWGLDEPVSHFAIRFGNFVFDSDFGGFNVHWYDEWNKIRKVVYSLKPKVGVDSSKVLNHIAEEFSGQHYDFGAYAYFGYRAALRKFLSIPLPVKNEWGSGERPICTEVAEVIQEHYPELFSTHVESFDIVTPFSLYENMRLSGKFIEE